MKSPRARHIVYAEPARSASRLIPASNDTGGRVEGMVQLSVQQVRSDSRRESVDYVAVEEPLEIRVEFEREEMRERRSISITMRTPGNDLELAAGFLLGEGIIAERGDVMAIGRCGAAAAGVASNIVLVQIAAGVVIDMTRLERHFYTSSSCGVCGKTSLEALPMARCVTLRPGEPRIDARTVTQLPERLRDAQRVFDSTGGLHAAALFTAAGDLIALREDVGRHNAVDKVLGSEFLEGRVPRHDAIMLVSGRASFELVQKSLMAGVPVLAAVGAPSSLAVALAAQHGMTLLGFVRDGRFNIYSAPQRVIS